MTIRKDEDPIEHINRIAAASRTFPVVMVTWVDSRQPLGEWQWLNELDREEPEPVVCVSVGLLLEANADAIRLATSVAGFADYDECQVSGVLVIPTDSVTYVSKAMTNGRFDLSGHKPRHGTLGSRDG